MRRFIRPHCATCWLWVAAFFAASCVGGPPIEPEEPEDNEPPYIHPDFLEPAREIVEIQTQEDLDEGNVRLRATPFDPNLEESLSYAWIGNRRQLFGSGQANASPEAAGDARFHRFDSIERSIDPCEVAAEGYESETVWLFISDRGFVEINNEYVVPGEGGFVDSHAWVLNYSPGLCAR